MDSNDLLEKLVARTGLSAAHIATLRKLEAVMGPLASEVALAFYDYLGRDPEMREILWAVPGRVERLYGSFARWYRELFSGCYDAPYAAQRTRIGLIHAAAGVKPSFIMPAMGIVQELSLEHMRDSLPGGDLLAGVEAFQKIIAIESALLQEGYNAAMEEGFRMGVGASHDEALVAGARVLLERAN
jgi:hypothetical protein